MMGYFIDMNNKIKYFSYLRVFACFEVVLLHTAYTAAGINANEILASELNVSQILVMLLMNAVPVFVMVTGALFLTKKQSLSIGNIFNKYIKRVLFALISASVLFFVFDTIMNKEILSYDLVKTAIIELITGTGWSHLWYIYLLIGLYLLMPFYKKIAANSDKKELVYLLFVYAIAISVMPLTKVVGINSGFYIHVSTIYPFYLFLGYAMHNKIISISLKKSIVFLLSGTAVSLLAGYFYYFKNIAVLSYFTGYSAFPLILQSIGVFGLFESIKFKDNKLVYSMDQCGFWIYLIHVIFVRLIFRYWAFNPFEYGNLKSIIIFGAAIMIYMLSYFTTFLILNVKERLLLIKDNMNKSSGVS